MEDGVPGLTALTRLNFVFDGLKGVEEKLANVSEDDGVAARDAIFGEEAEEFPEDVIDVAGGNEFAGPGDKFLGNLFGGKDLDHLGLAFREAPGVFHAEGFVAFPARHATPAIIGVEELATVGFLHGGPARVEFSRICGRAGRFRAHKNLKSEAEEGEEPKE